MPANFFLAYADSRDTSQSTLLILLFGAIAVGVVAIAAFVPIIVASRRAHRHYGAIMSAAVFWAFLAAASAVGALNDQIRWSDERNVRFGSGYYSVAQAQHDAPKLPWMIWAVLALCYLAMIVWAASAKKPRPVEPL